MRRTIVVVILAVAIAAFAALQTVFMNNTERELDAILDELEACVSEENWTDRQTGMQTKPLNSGREK